MADKRDAQFHLQIFTLFFVFAYPFYEKEMVGRQNWKIDPKSEFFESTTEWDWPYRSRLIVIVAYGEDYVTIKNAQLPAAQTLRSLINGLKCRVSSNWMFFVILPLEWDENEKRFRWMVRIFGGLNTVNRLLACTLRLHLMTGTRMVIISDRRGRDTCENVLATYLPQWYLLSPSKVSLRVKCRRAFRTELEWSTSRLRSKIGS